MPSDHLVSASRHTSMSVEDFSKLSIGEEMVTTRAGAARARTAPVDRSFSSQSTSPTPSSVSETVEIKSSFSGITYDLAALDDEARKRAGLALGDNAIGMKYCSRTGEQPNRYIFHIQDDITVAIGGRAVVPRCNCGSNESGIACKVCKLSWRLINELSLIDTQHIYWIEDHLTAGAPFNKEVVRLTADGTTVQDISPVDMLDRLTIESAAEALEWVFHDGPDVDPDDFEEEMNNLLSVFEPSGTLPHEFKDISGSPNLTQKSRKYREVADVIAKYASEDPGLFLALQSIIDPNFQAHAYFDKISDRIIRTFKALDEYIKHGPTDTPIESCDVVTCARKLKELVKLTEEHYQQQMENDPGSKDIAVRAAACLISILDGVTDRNYDAYANITWGGMAPLDPAQNNLYAALIGTSNELFVLDALRGFPLDDVLRNHWEVLSNIGDKLQDHNAPDRYLASFQSIVASDRRKRSTSDIAGNNAKRPMKSRT